LIQEIGININLVRISIGNRSKMAKDPICGMEVDEKKAKFMLVKDGKENYFCSKNCYNKFLEHGKAPMQEKSKNPINEKTVKKDSIENKISSKGSEIKKIIIPIKGMHCASCAATVEKSLKKVSGVKSANVNFASERASIEYDPEKADESRLERAVEDAGYKAIRALSRAA